MIKSVVEKIGRHAIATALGVGYSTVGAAVQADRFPAAWLLVMQRLGDEHGVEITMDMFSFKQPAGEASDAPASAAE